MRQTIATTPDRPHATHDRSIAVLGQDLALFRPPTPAFTFSPVALLRPVPDGAAVYFGDRVIGTVQRPPYAERTVIQLRRPWAYYLGA